MLPWALHRQRMNTEELPARAESKWQSPTLEKVWGRSVHRKIKT